MSSDRKNDLVWGTVRWPICPPRGGVFFEGQENEGQPVRYWEGDLANNAWIPLTPAQWSNRQNTGSWQLEFTPEEMIFLVEQMTGKHFYVKFEVDDTILDDPGITPEIIAGPFKGGRCRWPEFSKSFSTVKTLIPSDGSKNRFVWEAPSLSPGSLAAPSLPDTSFNSAWAASFCDATEHKLTWDNGNETTPDSVEAVGSEEDYIISFLEQLFGFTDIVRVYELFIQEDPGDIPLVRIEYEDFNFTDSFNDDVFYEIPQASYPRQAPGLQIDPPTVDSNGRGLLGWNGGGAFLSAEMSGDYYFASKSAIDSILQSYDNGDVSATQFITNLRSHLNEVRNAFLSIHSIIAFSGYGGECQLNPDYGQIWSQQELMDEMNNPDPNGYSFFPQGQWEFVGNSVNLFPTSFAAGSELMYRLPNAFGLVPSNEGIYAEFEVSFNRVLWDDQNQSFRVFFRMEYYGLKDHEPFLTSDTSQEAPFPFGTVVNDVYGQFVTTNINLGRPVPQGYQDDEMTDESRGESFFHNSDSLVGQTNEIYPFGNMDAELSNPFPEPLRGKKISIRSFRYANESPPMSLVQWAFYVGDENIF